MSDHQPRPPVRRGTLGTAAPPEHGERFDELVRFGDTVIEEITSSASPDAGPYDQEQDEWVVLLAGTADLDVDGQMVALAAGDWIVLPARTRHRVVRTSEGARWLAVHVRSTEVA